MQSGHWKGSSSATGSAIQSECNQPSHMSHCIHRLFLSKFMSSSHVIRQPLKKFKSFLLCLSLLVLLASHFLPFVFFVHTLDFFHLLIYWFEVFSQNLILPSSLFKQMFLSSKLASETFSLLHLLMSYCPASRQVVYDVSFCHPPVLLDRQGLHVPLGK